MVAEHPDDLELELARTGEASGEVQGHVAACAICRARSELFERLAAELAMESIEVPVERDRAVLSFAARRARARPGRRRKWLWAVPAAAVAAALLAIWPDPAERADIPARPLAAAPDVNADGTVDIVDAMLVASALPRERRPEWDANGDHRVDDDDVELIALAAVSLGGRDR